MTPAPCPQCGFDAPAGMRFCGRCGAALSRVCPACQFANPIDFRYCGMCGARLAAPSAPAAALPLPDLPAETAPAPARRPPGRTLINETFPLAEHQTRALQGERRIASVILADVRSSTDLLERMGSEAWVEIMNQVFQLLEAEVYRFGGEINQFRGDGLVAFFGASAAHEDDPERAVLAALAMQQAVAPYAAGLAQRQGIDLKLRVGVNTGEVIVASIGDSRQYKEDTAMGQAVAVAARMETAAEPGSVLASGATYQLVASRFQWQVLPPVTVKGIRQPIAVYRPLAHLPYEPATRRSLPSPPLASALLAGRSAQFQALQHCAHDLAGGRGGIALLTGDKGMGKGFLLSQLREHLAAEGETGSRIAWLHAVCRSYHQSWPYSMWLGLLQRWLGLPGPVSAAPPADDAPPGRQAAQERLHAEMLRLMGERTEAHEPYLASFLGLPVEPQAARRLERLDAVNWQRQFFLAVRSWLEAMTAQQPLLVALSDLQWADASSVDLLRYCLPLCDSRPVLWLASFRPDRASPAWAFKLHVETEYPHRLTRVELPPLTAEECARLVGEIAGPGALSPDTCARVVRQAEGNPYYVQEIIHALIARGALAQDAQTRRWREARALASLDLPDSLHNLLQARIDRLAPDERRALQVAAVVGSVFWRRIVALLFGNGEQGEARLQAALTGLQREQLIDERSLSPELGAEYAFSSSLVRDAAYESLLASQRVAYHQQIAEYLEASLSESGLGLASSMIAWHFRHAGNPNRELFYALQAAERARRVYANAEALQHYTRVLDVLDQLEAEPHSADIRTDFHRAIHSQRFEALTGRRDVLYRIGDAEPARADSRALLDLARRMHDDPAWLADALLAQPEAGDYDTRDQARAGLAMAEEALAIARRQGDRRREVSSLVCIGNLHYALNDPCWREDGDRALELLRELGDMHDLAHLLLGLSFACGMDNLDSGLRYLREAEQAGRQLNDREFDLRLLAALSAQAERDGDYHRQLAECERPRLRISQEMGDVSTEGHATMFCGQIQALYLGDYEGGLAQVEEAYRLWRNFTGRLYPLLRITQIQIAMGRGEEARVNLERARSISENDFTELGRAGLALVASIYCNTLGGETCWRQVLDHAAAIRQMVAGGLVSRQYEMAAACESAAAHLGLAAAQPGARQEHLGRAIEASGAALAIYQHYGFVQIVECLGEEILFRHSQTLRANGQAAEADAFARRAHDEMMRKHGLIPAGSPFRQTFLDNIRLHRDIRAAQRQE